MAIDDQIVLPEKNGLYKVVQIVLDGKPYLRFGDFHTDVHGKMLQRFLDEYRVPYATILSTDTNSKKIQIPIRQGGQYQLAGAGKAAFNLAGKIIYFHGESLGYSLNIDKQQLEFYKPLLPQWELRSS